MKEPSESDALLVKQPVSVYSTLTCNIFSALAAGLCGVVAITITSVIFLRNDLIGFVFSDDSDPSSLAVNGCINNEDKLAVVYEEKFSSLLKYKRGQKKFEASSVTAVDGYLYAICDNSWGIFKFNPSPLKRHSASNTLVGNPTRFPEDSGFEALFESNGTFYALRESVEEGNSYRSVVLELELGIRDYEIASQCRTEFNFDGTSKGFEGAVGFRDSAGELYILALCEGNRCSETHKNSDIGHGRVVLMRKLQSSGDGPGECLWETVGMVKIPKSAAFRDYSAIDITDNGRVAITSQEDSAIWIGKTTGLKHGIINPDEFAFDKKSGTMYSFPKSEKCETVYCNIEGIHFINDDRLVAVSDKMKGGGKQSPMCASKDQSLHVFELP